MTTERARSYDFNQVILTLNGVSISGWGSDGGVAYEFASDLITDAVGIGGEVTMSKINDWRMYLDITVKQTSRANTFIGSLVRAQRNNVVGEMPVVNVFMRNFITGEIVKDAQARFKTDAPPTQEAEAGDRVYRMTLPYAAKGMVHGTTTL